MNPDEVQGLLDAVANETTVEAGYETFVNGIHAQLVAAHGTLQSTINQLDATSTEKQKLQAAFDQLTGVTDQIKATTAAMQANIVANTDVVPTGTIAPAATPTTDAPAQ